MPSHLVSLSFSWELAADDEDGGKKDNFVNDKDNFGDVQGKSDRPI